MSSPLPQHATHAQPTTAQHLKGSDHDHHNEAEDGSPNHDGGPNGASSSDGDHADGSESGDLSDTDRPRRARQRTTVERSERPVDGSPASEPNGPRVTLTAGSDGTLWIVVDGADIHEVAAKISAVCDSLIPARPSRK